MRIVIHSPYFYPRLGGLENIVAMLAREFVSQKHEVALVTSTPGDGTDADRFPFPVRREGGLRALRQELRHGDVLLQFNISLKGLPALAITPRPWIVSHQSWFSHYPTAKTWQGSLKRIVSRFATNICCSEAVARNVGGNAIAVPNPYDDSLFHEDATVPRTDDLLVVARLVSDKGAHLAVQALQVLVTQGADLRLMIAGDGPERPALEALARSLGVKERITFTGAVPPSEIARLMRRHRILVVPSLWDEPFGIVALEGLASGSEVIVADCGGLPEAIGAHGTTFPKGDHVALAGRILESSNVPTRMVREDEGRRSHLLSHQAPAVARRYLEIMQERLRHGGRKFPENVIRTGGNL